MSMTEGELNNKIFVVLKFSFGWTMRETDFVILRDQIDLDATDDQVIDAIADYAQNHLYGHPSLGEFRVSQRKEHARTVLSAFARMSQAEREEIEQKEGAPTPPTPSGAYVN